MAHPPEIEARPRPGRWIMALTVAAAAPGLVIATATAAPAVPSPPPAPPVQSGSAVPESTLDARAARFVDRLAAISGRTLESLAEQAAAPGTSALAGLSQTVAGATAAARQDADALADLDEAEEAAAAQLGQTQAELRQAEAERDRAAKDLAEEEADAARQVDAAIDAAISAAREQSMAPLGDPVPGSPGRAGGGIPQGESTSTAKVLDQVRKHFPADQVGNAMAVARCESGHANRVSKPNGNGTRDFGIFQINDGGTLQAALRQIGVEFADIADARSKALEPELNVRMARAIWDSRGWQPWTCAAKIKLVAGLYQRAPGPMAGKFDDQGWAR